MGEAKQKRERLRALILRETENWTFAPTQQEAEIVADLKNRTPIMVQRAPDDQLAWARMKPRECHANAGWYADNDPTGQCRHVVGWWPQGDLYLLHSVVRTPAGMLCITPQLPDVPNPFPFIPDDRITWRPEGDVRRYYVGDWPILGPGVREDPAYRLEVNAKVREMLLAGQDPWSVMRWVDQDARDRFAID